MCCPSFIHASDVDHEPLHVDDNVIYAGVYFQTDVDDSRDVKCGRVADARLFLLCSLRVFWDFFVKKQDWGCI